MRKCLRIGIKYLLLFFGGFFVFVLTAQAAVLGDETDFFVDSTYDSQSRTQLTATLRGTGNYIYFYVDNEYYQGLNGTYKNGLREELEDLADEFDNVIYPRMRAVYGSEWTPGIDNDVRITVLISQLTSTAGGYINVYDAYSKSNIASSNEREMIYLNASNIFNDNNKTFLAHEFQHLITLYQKTIVHGIEEDVWLNEARSEYAPTVCGYNKVYNNSYLASRAGSFLEKPSDSLTEWKNELSDYGVATLFIHYLVDHYGEGILTQMTLNDKVGIASLNQALSDLGYSETFPDVFANWTAASYLNDCDVSPNGNYCYFNKNLSYDNLHVDYTASYSGFPNLIVSRSSSIEDWTPQWYRFRQGGAVPTDRDNLKLEFAGFGDRADYRVPYIITGYNTPTEVKFMSLKNQEGTIYVPDFTSLDKSIILMPFNQYRTSNFRPDEPSNLFSFIASSVSDEEVPAEEEKEEIIQSVVSYPEGSLLRAKGGYKVYIIKGNYKRWIQTAEIFNNYGHLTWDDIIDVDQSVLDSYQEAWLIRAYGDKKVYELNADATKHWLDMTAEEFSLTGRKWDMVFIVNDWERDFYATGANVRYK